MIFRFIDEHKDYWPVRLQVVPLGSFHKKRLAKPEMLF